MLERRESCVKRETVTKIPRITYYYYCVDLWRMPSPPPPPPPAPSLI